LKQLESLGLELGGVALAWLLIHEHGFCWLMVQNSSSPHIASEMTLVSRMIIGRTQPAGGKSGVMAIPDRRHCLAQKGSGSSRANWLPERLPCSGLRREESP